MAGPRNGSMKRLKRSCRLLIVWMCYARLMKLKGPFFASMRSAARRSALRRSRPANGSRTPPCPSSRKRSAGRPRTASTGPRFAPPPSGSSFPVHNEDRHPAPRAASRSLQAPASAYPETSAPTEVLQLRAGQRLQRTAELPGLLDIHDYSPILAPASRASHSIGNIRNNTICRHGQTAHASAIPHRMNGIAPDTCVAERGRRCSRKLLPHAISRG